MLTHIHPSSYQFTPKGVLLFTGPTSSGYSWNPPSAQSPFARKRCYLLHRKVSPHVSRHYPAFIAITGSCANPNPSPRLGITLGQQVFAGCCQPRLGVGPSRRYLCGSFPACLDPYPGGSRGALTRFFPRDFGLPDVGTRSAPYDVPTATSVGSLFRGCSHSLMFRPAGLLATPIAPTAVLTHRAAVASTSEPITVRYLPVPRIC